MSNHYHLLVEIPDANQSKGMRQLNGQSINRKHRRVGHLFQGRYKAILVDKDAYLLELCRYIVLNPVRAHMVNSPDEWLWSSWFYMVGRVESPHWLSTDALFLLFADNRQDAIQSYIKFVKCGVGQSILDDLQHQVLLGNDEFIEKYQLMLAEQCGDLNAIPLKQRSATPQSLVVYVQKAKSKHEAIFNAYKSGGYTQKQIGYFSALHYS
ncbi:addiction module toxin RelE [Vibrio breoganii]|nr:addiction module toxin RelE [Vibrio breoganii]